MWYYKKNNQSIGPIPIDELLNDIAELEQLLNEKNNNTLILDDEVLKTDCKKDISLPLIEAPLSKKTKFNQYKYLFILMVSILTFLILYSIFI